MDEEYWQVPRQLCYTGRQNDTTEERLTIKSQV